MFLHQSSSFSTARIALAKWSIPKVSGDDSDRACTVSSIAILSNSFSKLWSTVVETRIENSSGNFQFNKEGANFYIRDNTGNAVLQMDNSTRLISFYNNLTFLPSNYWVLGSFSLKIKTILGGSVNGNIPGSWPDDVGSSPALLNVKYSSVF